MLLVVLHGLATIDDLNPVCPLQSESQNSHLSSSCPVFLSSSAVNKHIWHAHACRDAGTRMGYREMTGGGHDGRRQGRQSWTGAIDQSSRARNKGRNKKRVISTQKNSMLHFQRPVYTFSAAGCMPRACRRAWVWNWFAPFWTQIRTGMYWYVLVCNVCTCIYCYIMVCGIGMIWHVYEHLVWTCMFWYMMVCTNIYLYILVYSSMYCTEWHSNALLKHTWRHHSRRQYEAVRKSPVHLNYVVWGSMRPATAWYHIIQVYWTFWYCLLLLLLWCSL